MALTLSNLPPGYPADHEGEALLTPDQLRLRATRKAIAEHEREAATAAWRLDRLYVLEALAMRLERGPTAAELAQVDTSAARVGRQVPASAGRTIWPTPMARADQLAKDLKAEAEQRQADVGYV
jgi:hypothetical protein